ncbi:hypothetical protein PAXRUDRAFT_555436 [Paxillus rubicundulus Ve08.2h10]|uniref:Secreted protein n=1 Tax=Paxillus rubicundulus Ve08.2h10 TaxID=930991 RepID=A0A0D0DUJ8_9AGAM|nr:hypothetical protein PAXRUDRAFT_555436 [Paxillus rubicundulus Ve08.2h10]
MASICISSVVISVPLLIFPAIFDSVTANTSYVCSPVSSDLAWSSLFLHSPHISPRTIRRWCRGDRLVLVCSYRGQRLLPGNQCLVLSLYS